jgi:hypothetical protein
VTTAARRLATRAATAAAAAALLAGCATLNQAKQQATDSVEQQARIQATSACQAMLDQVQSGTASAATTTQEQLTEQLKAANPAYAAFASQIAQAVTQAAGQAGASLPAAQWHAQAVDACTSVLEGAVGLH